MDVEHVVELFDLGTPREVPSVEASGWGGRNKVWRFRTSVGDFAVKQVIPELVPEDVTTAFRIEEAAHAAGVPSARPVRSIHGRCFEDVDGFALRCHRWVSGTAKNNEETTPPEARCMGALVAHLHGLELEAGDVPPARPFGRDHWLGLARRSPTARWARLVEENIDRIERAEAAADGVGGEDPIGTHRDLNAHNVLFAADQHTLIDWDAAGPAWARYERASLPTLWAQRHDGTYDRDVATAFLRGYRAGGGTVTHEDPDVLPRWLDGVAWWTERNLQIAVAQPSTHHDELACHLVHALASGPPIVAERQRFLAEVIGQL